MNIRRSASVLIAVSITICLCTIASAVEFPDWWGVDDGMTTSFHWSLDADPGSGDPQPDFVVNPFDEPLWSYDTDFNARWFESANNRNGVFGVSPEEEGWMSILIDNYSNPNCTKEFWMRVDYVMPGDSLLGLGLYPADGSDATNFHQYNDVDPDGWSQITLTWDIVPQPDYESFTFRFEGDGTYAPYIDNIYIGTHCVVPEPATMTIVGVGLLMAMKRKRNH